MTSSRPLVMPPGRRLKAVVFDMDGTLIDSATVIPDSYIACVKELGGRLYTREQVIDAYSVGPPEAMLTHLLGRPSTSDEVDDYHNRLRMAAHGVRVYDGVNEALSELEQMVPLAVFTGASIRACRILLDAAGLISHFKALVGADEVTRSKPHPDGIFAACARLGVEASAAAYVGDSANDLEAARRSEALALAAGWGHLYRPGVASDAVLSDPRDLLSFVETRGDTA